MQALVGAAAIANGGEVLEPNMILGEKKTIKRTVRFDQEDFDTVREGMRQTALIGTTRTLNFDFVEIAAKSGSAQIKSKTRENSWTIGFFPYKEPK